MTVHALIERAARAQEMIELGDDVKLIDAFWPRFSESARAVVLDLLAALGEPSEAMMFEAVRLADERIPHLREAWRAMLSALRTEITAQDNGE